MKKKQDLSDQELLSLVLKDVTPLPGRTIKKEIKKNVTYTNKPSKGILSRNITKTKSTPKSKQPYLSHGDVVGLDRRSAQRMKRGKMKIDAKLDLHGYYQDEACRALLAFIAGASKSNKRCLLVVTGKGLHHSVSSNQQAGILKKMVPKWLNEEPNRSKILSFSLAIPSDGGAGALYVLLKRRRSDEI